MAKAVSEIVFQSVCRDIAAKLADPGLLDARRAGRHRFSPTLAYGRHNGPAPSKAKPAAVLIALQPTATGWTIPLTVRPKHLPDHPGQVSFPGGRLEAGENWTDAATREYHEELGVPFSGKLIGSLTPTYVYNSNYIVEPIVGVCKTTPGFEPCQQEVERVLTLPIANLLDTAHHPVRTYQRGSASWQAREVRVGDDAIWGATAILLGELAAVLEHTAVAG
ncbi:MAG: CoA pyrophosphatase [Pirellulaceae bacterium]